MTTKSEQTKKKIVRTALKLFRTRGYEKTTMSLIAARAGVSKGNAYYYFRSKEELIQSFYDELQARHRELAAAALASTTSFEERLRRTLLAWLEAAAPYHAFADKLFKTAASPESPLSPFSAESAPARDGAIAVFHDVIAPLELDDESRAELPKALWLLHMSLVLFWVFDRSPQQERSRAVAERVAGLVATVVELIALPFAEPMRAQALGVLRDVAAGLRI